METIIKEIDKVRRKLKNRASDKLLLQKPFAEGMYRFSMFIINYYSRVRQHIKIDYDSFMIIQTVVSSNLYLLNKEKGKLNNSYEDLESEWNDEKLNNYSVLDLIHDQELENKNKLTVSSICLVTSLPKETVRRKVSQLIKKNLLKNSKKDGISLGPAYKKVFQEFVPDTTQEVVKLLKIWENSGVLKSLLNFKF